MKRLTILSYFFFIAVFSSTAQVELDTVSEKFEMLNNYEFATGKNIDTKSLFKLMRNGGSSNNLALSFEQKLGASFSLIGAIKGDWYYNGLFESEPRVLKPLNLVEISLEARCYLNQRALVKKGLGNNVNGFYVTARVANSIYRQIGDYLPVLGSLGVGVQSRILKYGILDFSLLANFNDEFVSFIPNVKAGFAISKNYKNLEFNSSRCNILKCFEERNFQFKIPLSSAFLISYSSLLEGIAETGYIRISPKVEFEHRLFKGLSLNHGLSYSTYLRFTTFVDTDFAAGSGLAYTNNLRWYVLKSRNIAKGKSADNLSGLYAQSHVGISTIRESSSFYNSNNGLELLSEAKTTTYGLAIGYQTRVFKRLYVDLTGSLIQADKKYSFTHSEIELKNSKVIYSGLSLEFGFLF